jgi:phosphatidylserine/phosphatidylglycerophosphate/cardiolipin synthase-like enzyme
MATNEELGAKYFFITPDAHPPTEPVPSTYLDSLLTPIIDCAEYNQEIENALATVGLGANKAANKDDFIFIANWWLGLEGGEYVKQPEVLSAPGPKVENVSPYTLDGPGGTKVLRDILKDKKLKGVDVRVLGFLSKGAMGNRFGQLYGPESVVQVNSFTVKSIVELRKQLKDPKGTEFPNAIFNVISHTAGAVHIKMVVVGNATTAIGFTGGLDFDMQRFAHPAHAGDELWHDVVVKVQGPAVQHLYSHFVDMWRENLRLDVVSTLFEGSEVQGRLDDTQPLNPKTFPLPGTAVGPHRAQGLRTIPNHDYADFNLFGSGEKPQFPAGAQSGLFEIRGAWRKAISQAEQYIYIEDQAFWSSEIFGWIGQRVRSTPGLRVILVTSGAADPNDPKFPDGPIRTEGLNEFLLKPPGGPPLTVAQRDQIRFFKRFGDSFGLAATDVQSVTAGTVANQSVVVLLASPIEIKKGSISEVGWLRNAGNYFKIVANSGAMPGSPITLIVENLGTTLPVVGTANGEIFFVPGIIVHAKTTIVDDSWALIGSANFMRRSLYTDWEHSMAFVDTASVKEYRKNLWNEVLRHSNPADLDDLQQALHVWAPTWGTAGGTVTLPARPPGTPPVGYLVPVPIPFTPTTPFSDNVRAHVDMWVDPDSRESWGGVKPHTLEQSDQ